jgi:mRNA interferase RelE/StbE
VICRVVVAHEAEKILDRLDRPTEQRIRARFVQLAEDPFDPRLSAPLTERAGVRKSRVGGWRILFTVDRDAKVLYVLTVDTRGQVYRHS